MDDQCGDVIKNIEITAEHAVLIPTLTTVKNVMAYVEAVAVVIGSCHIHSVYEDGDHVKIYLNDKRFVDILVNNGVSILGRQMNVDYAVPRADRVILSNVDPIVPDQVLMKLLSYYGLPVSTIIHEKIATNSEYSHIECGKRKVYMKIFSDKKIPNKINFTFQDVCYRIDVIVEQYDRNAVTEQPPPVERNNEEEMNDELLEVGSNQSLKPNLTDLMNNLKEPTPRQLAYRNRGKSSGDESASTAVRRIKRRARGGWYASRLTRVKRMKALPVNPNPVSRAAKRLVVERMAPARKGRPAFKRLSRASSHSIATQEINPDPFDVVELSADENLDQSSSSGDQPDLQSISQYPLSSEELQKFVFKTRFHREPLQVAMEILAENKVPDAILALKTQLQEYQNACKEQALKLRIKRLVTIISNMNENTD